MSNDDVLDDIARQRAATNAAIIALYDAIRDAKSNDYSYNELEAASGFTRGTVQNIVAGSNPRFSVVSD
ncbi:MULTISPECIES: hypothetical protein [Mycolicibacterium]|jgi:hypothetical protein|uniref:Uncharacterized protein n=3 Tax=Mycolicibacterium fortuitum TaxID=1766 RepID=A0AAE4VIX4_MYCFO|nr:MULTISPECIES: hypothetical protein [Mycolicibacterium]AIY49021.1 hypothetical protein G155_29910 [Mycobacterium sp. VKM Ac-1817D]AMD56243.1 hypothetical protein ATO49_28620 [Mycolicibacterium fortuitum subsp. fortuitum DSM 46621 = ATCC 6841 = JCM 6387]EJZ13933.1 hypothetical protein MFORT_12226 [Mycolicibacterium fortuitum subsp. fortuitum DSM 46621 = ATCC 6841 = JCM 6387]MBP3083093.1 hypothetical protein [Mycolicibacterium fortuitum]MCA4721290.1 hypothetical protein [Mycolicibacterium fort